MKGHLEKIRNRPDHEKKKLVTTLALITTGLIVVIWLIILSIGNNSESEIDVEEGPAIESSFMNAINAVIESNSNDFDEIVTGFDEVNEAFNVESYQQAQVKEEANQNGAVSPRSPTSFFEDPSSPENINETQNYEE